MIGRWNVASCTSRLRGTAKARQQLRVSRTSLITSNARRNTRSSLLQSRIRSKQAMPSSPQATATPSMMQLQALRRVVSRPACRAAPLVLLASNDSEAVVLDLVQPAFTGGRTLGRCREARPNRRQGTRTQHIRLYIDFMPRGVNATARARAKDLDLSRPNNFLACSNKTAAFAIAQTGSSERK